MAQNAPYIAPKELKRLSQLTPWRTALAIAFDWAVIVAAVFIAEWTDSWLAWLIAVPVIAGSSGFCPPSAVSERPMKHTGASLR